MIIEVGLVGLLIAAWKKAGQRGKITEEREQIYLSALSHLTDPLKLNELADSFDKEGLAIQAKMLRKRAEYRDAKPEIKKARRQAYDDGMKSNKPEAIEKLALAFESQSATGAAAALRKRASVLREQAAQQTEIVATVSEDVKGSDVGKGEKGAIDVVGIVVDEENSKDKSKLNGASEAVEIVPASEVLETKHV
jgi:hypothetical protein